MKVIRFSNYVLVLALVGPWPTHAHAQFEEAVPRVLLLKNGQVLAGDVEIREDGFHVSLPNGEIVLKEDDVEHVCTSIVEGYLRKRAAIRFGGVKDRLTLARWCIGQKLLDEAKAELAEARALSPNHKSIAAIERQLAIASQAPAEFPKPNRERIEKKSLDLDALVRSMPHGSVESFTKFLQPVFINSCSASSCHGGNAKNDFRLMRFPRGRAAPRRVTLRNLHAVLAFVDSEQPGSSRILQAASEPHGSKEIAAIDRASPAFQRLATWVLQVTNAPQEDPAPKSLPDTQQTLSQAINVQPNATKAAAPLDGNPPAPPSFAPQLGNDSFRPRDPFDPEQFNRQFHGDTP